MRHSYRIEPESRIVYLRWEAGNTFEDWEVLLSTILEDQAFETGFNFLSDRRTATADPPSRDYAKQVVEFFKNRSDKLGRCKWAAVASDSTTYGIACLLAALAAKTSVEVQVFRDRDVALQWLLH
jgi:hypothetical protein